MNKTAAQCALITLAMSSTASCLAEITANAALTTNYVWRGETYTDDKPALQGGLDWNHDNGVYAGTWLSNTDDGTETDIEYDLYVGYSLELKTIGLDFGVAYYDLIDANNADVTEIYAGVSFEALSAYYYIDSDNDTTYITAAYGFDVNDFSLNVFAGSWGDTADGMHFGITGGVDFKGYSVELTFDVSDEDLEDETLVYLMVSREWEL